MRIVIKILLEYPIGQKTDEFIKVGTLITGYLKTDPSTIKDVTALQKYCPIIKP